MALASPSKTSPIPKSRRRHPSNYRASNALQYHPPAPSSLTAHSTSSTSQLLYFLQQPSPHQAAQHQLFLKKSPTTTIAASFLIPPTTISSYLLQQTLIQHFLILCNCMCRPQCTHPFTCSFHVSAAINLINSFSFYLSLPPASAVPVTFLSTISSPTRAPLLSTRFQFYDLPILFNFYGILHSSV